MNSSIVLLLLLVLVCQLSLAYGGAHRARRSDVDDVVALEPGLDDVIDGDGLDGVEKSPEVVEDDKDEKTALGSSASAEIVEVDKALEDEAVVNEESADTDDEIAETDNETADNEAAESDEDSSRNNNVDSSDNNDTNEDSSGNVDDKNEKIEDSSTVVDVVSGDKNEEEKETQ